MQSQRMQHSARTLHHNQYSDRKEEPDVEGDDEDDDAEGTGHAEPVREGHGPEDDRELLMREGEGPETEVGGGVGDAVEAEF